MDAAVSPSGRHALTASFDNSVGYWDLASDRVTWLEGHAAAVKTAAFGDATNWTLGLPYLRTSVDHGTAYGIAGRGVARLDSLRAVVATTLDLIRRSR